MKITVVGAGYVGLANAILLAHRHQVLLLDIDPIRVAAINSRVSPLEDAEIKKAFAADAMSLRATTDVNEAYVDAEIIIVATPTDFSTYTQCFDTTSVESVVREGKRLNSEAVFLVKSTVPIGFTDDLALRLNSKNIIFCPEFLREGQALYDCFNPSRIVVGENSVRGANFARMFSDAAASRDVKVLLTTNSEAESIKLFSNTYLAMRVAFFNELDSFALKVGLSSKNIIEGVCMDTRIGDNYNNPSFGYGGYCLPKDTKQLLVNYSSTPQNLIKAVVESNETRRDYLCEIVLARKPRLIGFYRLVMKSGSENFRSSAVVGLMERLALSGAKIAIYEPLLNAGARLEIGGALYSNLESFKADCDLILANRNAIELDDVREKVFSRDLFGNG